MLALSFVEMAIAVLDDDQASQTRIGVNGE